MVNINKLTFGFFCSICMSMLVACSSQDDILDDIQKEEDANQPHTCKLVLNVTKSCFSDEPQSRSAASWADGDKIYLTFTVGESTSHGDAIYNNGSWTVNYFGSLTQNTAAKCSAVYFENSDFESGSVVHLTENTAIYEDSVGSYIYNGNTLSVIANLKPKTGRIRFAGKDKDKITLYGITHFTSYDYSTGRFTNSITSLKTTVASDYTPYIYGTFSDADQPRINLITATSGYTRMPSASIYKPGESGFMTIPTELSHNGWQNSVIFKVNGVEFNMIPVSYSSGNFLLAETETTEQLYNAITVGPSSDSQIEETLSITQSDNVYSAISRASTSKSQLPKSGLSWDNWVTFISKLSALTELDFRMPTKSEWEYAAKGGSKSKGYTYSGSNIISNVAWYSGNSNSAIHPVKQLQPNELGFYDMSGNVLEPTSNSYSSSDHYWYGGSYLSAASSCTVTSSTFYSDYSSYKGTGLRIALSN